MHEYTGAWPAVVDYLEHIGLPVAFGLPADDLHLLRAFAPGPVRMVLYRDQRNAMFAATGWAMQSGRTGVCVVGKGPAVTNTVTGLLEARSSGVPLVVLAGGTGVDRRGSGAFQELDQLSLVTPLTKWAQRVDDASRVVPTIERAFLVAASGAPGPVYVEIPDHLLTETVQRTRPWSAAMAAGPRPDPATVAEAARLVRAARRPIVVVGGGMRHGNADRILERLAERLGAPVFATASGRGAVDEEHPSFGGLCGLY